MQPTKYLLHPLCLILLSLGMTLNSQAADPRTTGTVQIHGDGGMPKDGLLYRPPSRGAPAVRIGAGSRGFGNMSALPVLMVLAPDHTALTSSSQPTLYWFLSATHPGDIEFSISREGQIDPVLEVNLGPAEYTGFHHLNLADHGVSLEPGVEYSWYVTLIVNPNFRSKDHSMGGAFTVKPRTVEISGESMLEQAIELAQAGYWHDAIDALSHAIDEDPANIQLRDARAKMLDQVGLSAAAEYDQQRQTTE